MNNPEKTYDVEEAFDFKDDFTDVEAVSEAKEYNEIKTEVELTQEGNLHNDCGALSASMVMKSINPELSKNYNLEKIKELTMKEGEEGILPGNICKALTDMGFIVEYYSNIDWGKCTLDPNKYFELYDEKVKNFPSRFFKSNDNLDGMIVKEKLSESAVWIAEHDEIIKRNQVDFELISSLLSEGKRLIALMHGSHYVVITGIDENSIYINNPLEKPVKEVINKVKFEKTWLELLNSKELIAVSAP